MEIFQDRGVWIRIRSWKKSWIRIPFVLSILRGFIRIRIWFVLRGSETLAKTTAATAVVTDQHPL